MPTYVNLTVGESAPVFRQRSYSRSDFAFEWVGGLYSVLCFFASAGTAEGHAAMEAALDHKGFFDEVRGILFGVSLDPRDESQKRISDRRGCRILWDFDGNVSKLYGALALDSVLPAKGPVEVRCLWVVLDPTLRVLKVIAFAKDGSDRTELLAYLDSLPPPSRFAGFEVQAPVLVLPNVFDPAFCQTLISLYEEKGGVESGTMQLVDGKTVCVHDTSFKRRKDYYLQDTALIKLARARISRCVVPQIGKAHQFKATRIERYLVGCYAAEDGGHFRPHRDNTTPGTAHRQFALSVNLNDDFDGGEVSFPEYGPRGFKAPAGGAVVFSCSLLHAVSRVTAGKRYAFLPFLYDDEAAKIREANIASITTTSDSAEA